MKRLRAITARIICDYLRCICESPFVKWAVFPLHFSSFPVSSSSLFVCSSSCSSNVTGIWHSSFLVLNSLDVIVGGTKMPRTVCKGNSDNTKCVWHDDRNRRLTSNFKKHLNTIPQTPNSTSLKGLAGENKKNPKFYPRKIARENFTLSFRGNCFYHVAFPVVD